MIINAINDLSFKNDTAYLFIDSYLFDERLIDDFLRLNKNIKYVSISSSDKRYFELENQKLKPTKNSKFLNPYYEEDFKEVKIVSNCIEERIKILESRVKIMGNTLSD